MDSPSIVPVDDRLVAYDSQGTITTGLKNLWRNCSAFLVCGGPSLNDLPYHLLAERGVASLAINGIAAKVPVKAMTFSDPPEKWPEAIWLDPGIMKLVRLAKLTRGETRRKMPDGSLPYTGKHARDYPNVWAFKDRCWHTPETFLTEDSATFGNNNAGVERTGRPKIIFTFFLGIRLLHFLGVRRIYLLGADFYMDPAKGTVGNYAFEDGRYTDEPDREKAEREARGVVDGNNAIYRQANAMLIELRPYLEAAGLQVFNCYELSGLRAFDYVPFDEALDDCRNGIPPGPVDTAGWYQKNEKPPRKRRRRR